MNATEVNAFALPGGPMYVNRGLITTARSEAELAGVLAHEMAHVALRHGTTQASKAYLGQAGLSILGGLLGRSNSTAKIVNAVGGFGLNAAFLKFSRDDEYEADQAGAEIMARAGYNPAAMADLFTLLRQEQGRDPSKLERFFSSHPPPAKRSRSLRRNYAPFEDRENARPALEDATDDLVSQILVSNSYLSAPSGSARAVVIDGARGYAMPLADYRRSRVRKSECCCTPASWPTDTCCTCSASRLVAYGPWLMPRAHACSTRCEWTTLQHTGVQPRGRDRCDAELSSAIRASRTKSPSASLARSGSQPWGRVRRVRA